MSSRSTGLVLLSAEMKAVDLALSVITFAPDSMVTHVNANFLKLVGYSAREVVGHHQSLVLPDDEVSQTAHALLWANLRRGDVQAIETRLVGRGGVTIWVAATYTPVLDPQGRLGEVVAFVQDITPQKSRAAEQRGQIAAINMSQAVIHFRLDGTITDANDIFLRTMGYRADEVVGQHHRMFVEPAYAQSTAYADFWSDLAAGRFKAGEFKRIGERGREVWLRAHYMPIADVNGLVSKVVKYASDVTSERKRQSDYEGQIDAIHKSQGVITFDMNGTVLDANAHFLEAVGYRLDEIEGRHHRMFVDPSYTHGPEYAAFWSDLAEGRHQAGEYKRFGKNGREVWLQATYNPVLDLNGRPCKVVKYATTVTREKLRQADHQGQIASIHKAQCVISFDMDGTITDANDNFLAATGYRLAEVRGQHHRMFVDAKVAASPRYASFWQELAFGRYRSGEYKTSCRDGREIWLQASYNPIFDMSGRPFKVVKYALDVTQERLKQADYDGQIAAIHKSQCVVTFDMDGTVLDANDNFLNATGYSRAEVEGRHHRMFVEPKAVETDTYRAFWETLRSGTFLSGKFSRIGKDDRPVWLQASYNPILDMDGRPFKVVKIATDITADVALAADLSAARQQAYHDAATALPNRVRLAEFLSEALATPDNRLVVLFMDLDHFKPINDTFGHEVGDHVLIETAKRLRRATGPGQLVARVGGDEFVLAAPNLSDERIEMLCEQLIAAVKAPIRHDKSTLAVGLSIGVAVSPGDGVTADDLLRNADVALYRSKGRGRGSYSFFAAEVHERLLANRHLAHEMQHGIKAGEFFVDYQPRFDARTRELEALVARVRWSHPDRGPIDAEEFLPVAETSGLIVPLGDWVLRTACEDARAWPDVGISVPISPVQMRAGDLPGTVAAVLAETGLEPGLLELDIREAVLTHDPVQAKVLLDILKALGVKLAINEIGSGHLGLNDLLAFPIDAFRIDPRFIADIESQEGGLAIAQGIARFCKAIGSSLGGDRGTVASGLLLRLQGGSEVQGFLLAKAISADRVGAVLAGDPEQLAAAG